MIIKPGHVITVDITNAVCNSLTLGDTGTTSPATITFFDNTSKLTVTTSVQIGLDASHLGSITMPAGGILICDDLTARFPGTIDFSAGSVEIDNPTTLPADTSVNIYNDLTIGTGTLSNDLTVNGTLTVLSSLDGGSSNLNLAGDFNNSGSFTGNTGTVNFNNLAPQTATGNFGFNAVIFNGPPILCTGNIAVNNAMVNGGVTVMGSTTINISFTNGGATTLSSVNGAGTFTQSPGGMLSYGGATFGVTANFSAPGNFVTYTNPTASVVATTYGALTILSASGATPDSGSAFMIAGPFAIGPSGHFNAGSNSYDLQFGFAVDPTAMFTPSSSSFTFSGGAPQMISGNVSLNNVTVSAGATVNASGSIALTATGTFTNNGNTTLVGGLTGGMGNLIQGGTGTLVYGGADLSGVTVDFSAAGNSVEYTHVPANIANTIYDTLIVSSTSAIPQGGGPITVNKAFTISPGATFNVSGTNTINLAGDFMLTGGTFAPSLSTVNFTGATPQTITGATVAFNAVTFSGAAPKSFSGNVTVGAASSIAVGVVVNIATGSTTLNALLTNNGILNVNSVSGSGSITNTANAILTVTGAYTLASGTFTATNNFVNFTGSGAQTVPAMTFNNLSVSGGNTKTVGGNVTVNNILAIGPGTFFDGSSFTLQVKGNFSTNPTGGFTASTSTVVLSGATAQVVLGANTFFALQISNAAGVTLGANQTIANALNLTAGKLDTGPATLKFGVAATATGGSATSYVIGNITKTFNPGASPFTFPLGDASVFSPINIANLAVTTSGDLSVATTPSQDANFATSGLDSANAVNRFWKLQSPNTLAGTFDATFNFVAGDVVGGPATGFVVRQFNGTAWSAPANGTATATSGTVTGLSASALGEFQIGKLKPTTIAPTIVSQLTACGDQFQPFTYTISATGTAPISYTATGLPAGLSLTGAVISGSPSVYGTFSVTLTASNAATPADSKTLSLTIVPQGISITSPTSAQGKVGAQFNYSFSGTSGAPPVSFTIGTPLPGGLIASGSTISGTPTTAGDFTVPVTATDAAGQTFTGSLAISILAKTGNSAPIVDPILTDIPTGDTGDVGTPVDFSVNAVDPEGGNLTYAWTITAGATPAVLANATASEYLQTFDVAGTYTVRVTVTDGSGASAFQETTISVTTPAPSAPTLATISINDPDNSAGGTPIVATSSTKFPTAGDTVVLTSKGATVVTGPLQYTWDFGDGSAISAPSTAVNITHVYATAGDYTVTLDAIDANNVHAAHKVTALVSVVAPPTPTDTVFVPLVGQSMGTGGTTDAIVPDPMIAFTSAGVVQVTLPLGTMITDAGPARFTLSIQVSTPTTSLQPRYRALTAAERDANDFTTDFGISGRGLVKGTEPSVHYQEPKLFVATTHMRDKATKVEVSKARITLPVSRADVGLPPVVTAEPKSRVIGVTGVAGAFNFSRNSSGQTLALTPGTAADLGGRGDVSDKMTVTGSFEMPAGLDMSKPQEVQFALGNVVETIVLSPKGMGKSTRATLKVSTKSKTGMTTAGQMAKYSIQLNAPGLSAAGFESEGVTDKPMGKGVVVHGAMMIGGITYAVGIPTTYGVKAKGTSTTGALKLLKSKKK